MAQSPFRDLVVMIPGILGSKLARRRGDQLVTVWDLSMAQLPRLIKEMATGGLILEGNGIDPPDDGIEAVDLFNYQLLPGFFGVDDYKSLVDFLRLTVGPRQLIVFPYDWRLSNRHAAKQLEAHAIDALTRWKAASGNDNARLWLICHSMGGLVARYFCEYLGGSEHTRAVITIGTPHRGSVKALEALVNGKRYGPFDLTPLIRSLPSVYQLLPLFPVLRQERGETAELRRVAELFGLDPVSGEEVPGGVDSAATRRPPPLPGLDRAMLKRALEFHRQIRVPAEARAEKGEPSPYQQEAFFNRRQRTALSARINIARLDILEAYPEKRGDRWVEDDARGDGTVPSFSSVPIEWSDSRPAIAIGEKHAQMQAAVAVRDTILNWLRPVDVRAKRGGSVDDAAVIELDVPATLFAGDDLVVSTATAHPANGFVDVVHVESNTRTTKPVALAGDHVRRETVFRGLASGTHRVTARPENRMMPAVSDYVYVIDPTDSCAVVSERQA